MSEQNINTNYSVDTDPLHKPIDENKKKLIDDAVEKQIKNMTLNEIVDKDEAKIPGQNYALISIVAPQTRQKHDEICIKIKGVFSTIEEANKHASMLQKIDSVFDIYVVEMYSWLLVPPNTDHMEQTHVDSKLNELISNHRSEQLKAKAHFDERKRELISNINIDTSSDKVSKDIVDITDSTVDINAESKIDVENGTNCPNSSPLSEDTTNVESTPTDIMESMLDK